MADEIIDLRDRIEKMRIQIENESSVQILNQKPIEVHHKVGNSKISMSLQEKENVNDYQNINQEKSNLPFQEDIKNFTNRESFPSLSLSVKNPISSKVLVVLIALQILSNIGILYFLYIGME